MPRAVWKDTTIAQADETELVEGNHYFARGDVGDHLRPSATTSVCPWKGTASYFDVVVDGDVNKDAAWTYEEPKPEAARIKGRIAFWKGVDVQD